MSTKKGIWRWALASAAMVFTSSAALAGVINSPPSVTTNTSAGVVIFPKIRVDASNAVDTLVQLTNTSTFLTRAHCFWVNANGHCNNDPAVVCDQVNFRSQCPTGGLCTPGWQEVDFHLTLTKRQPISWSASSGRSTFPLPPQPGEADLAQSNKDSNIPPVPEVPFIGELRCVQIDVATELPIASNDLKGEATIVRTDGTLIDASKYNAIGIPALDGTLVASDNQSATLNIGGPDANYNACPQVLTLNHFFDGAAVQTHGGAETSVVTSDLTLVPCSADFLNQAENPASATVQFLIFNEFEQRFSTSMRVTCYKEQQLSDIDTRPGNTNNENMSSIFAVGVQGTFSGQSRLRAVPGSGDYDGNGILGILEERWSNGAGPGGYSSAAANVQYSGTRAQGDQIVIPWP